MKTAAPPPKEEAGLHESLSSRGSRVILGGREAETMGTGAPLATVEGAARPLRSEEAPQT